jgi:hypothetical protein
MKQILPKSCYLIGDLIYCEVEFRKEGIEFKDVLHIYLQWLLLLSLLAKQHLINEVLHQKFLIPLYVIVILGLLIEIQE